MEFFAVFLLGVLVAIAALAVLRPGLLVKPNLDYSVMQDMAEEMLARLEQRQAELDRKYQEILEAIAQGEQRLLRLSEEAAKALKAGNLTSPKVQAVLALRGQGLDERSIAKKLGVGVGEVQLILALNESNSP